jgi:hypothetical protein
MRREEGERGVDVLNDLIRQQQQQQEMGMRRQAGAAIIDRRRTIVQLPIIWAPFRQSARQTFLM